MTVRHAFEDVFKIGERLDLIELGGGDKGADSGPTFTATVGTREQVVLALERDGSDRTFNRIVVEVDTAII